jgi:SAM-dependent methyltransferase
MSEIIADGPNAAQIAYWNAEAGATWAQMQDTLDRELKPLGLAAMAALAPMPGERVIDVGCGCGTTSQELAARVGPGGRVLGVDISAPQLAVAERRAEGMANLTFAQADAQTHAFAGDADAIFSRFGVMFFTDPPAAFANLRSALKPGGRLGFVCWRGPLESECMSLPMMAAVAAAPELATPPGGDPFAPGPFAFADQARVRGILEGAGFKDLVIAPHDEPVSVGGLDDTVAFSLRIGVLGARLREAPHLRDKVVDAIRAALADRVTDGEVRLGSGTWIVTATA